MNSQTPITPPDFALSDALNAEALSSAELPLCRAILRNERRYPWVVLIPRRANVGEIFDLEPLDQTQIWAEINRVAAELKSVTSAKKINIALFGNMTPQLHVHIVARSEGDAHWPGSAVGVDAAQSYGSGVVPDWWPLLLDRLDLKAL